MQQTLFAMLTDEQARSHEAIEASLNQEFMVGTPWFIKALTEPFDTQQTLEQ